MPFNRDISNFNVGAHGVMKQPNSHPGENYSLLFIIVHVEDRTCLIASTIVTVLPVPGGPNTR